MERWQKKGGGNVKVDICHFDEDTGLFHLINISDKAVDKHIANHGDFPPFEVGEGEDPCVAPTTGSLGSYLFIGQGGLHGHKVNIAMAFGDGAGGFTLDVAGLNSFEDNRTAVGDFNNDGLDDVVVTRSGGAVFVALGDFADGMQTTDFAVIGTVTDCCNRARETRVVDLNNDGNLDIVVSTWTDISVLLGNGDGTFGSEIVSPAIGGDVRSIAMGDFDGYGNVDITILIAANCCWALGLHLGNGDGSFATGTIIPDSTLTFPNIRAADMDADGDIDIVTGSLEGRFKVFVNDGSAGFALTDVDPGTFGFLLIVEDLNGNGAPEVIVYDSGSNLLVTINDGTGGFVSTNSPGIQFAADATIADIDEDGVKDVAFATGTGVSVMLGNGDGTFAAPSSVAAFPRAITIGAGNFD